MGDDDRVNNSLGKEGKMSAIDLVKTPEQVFGRAVDVVAAGVVGKVVSERGSTEFLFEEIDLVEEEDDAGPHEPARVDHRIEQDQGFHHPILFRISRWDLVLLLHPFHGMGQGQAADEREGTITVRIRLGEGNAYLMILFQKDLIVLAEGHTEDDGGDVLEAMDPLLPFTTLSADVEHASRRMMQRQRMTGRGRGDSPRSSLGRTHVLDA